MEGRIRHLDSRCSRTPRSSRRAAPRSSQAGSIVDDPLRGRRRVRALPVGSIEERHDDLDVISPGFAARRGAARPSRSATSSTSRRRRGRDCLEGRDRRPRTAMSAGRRLRGLRRRRAGRIELPGRGTHLRARGRRDRRARHTTSCCCTAGRRPPASTGSWPSSRSAERFRVVALDHRGHGRGIRIRQRSGSRTAPTTSPPWPTCSASTDDPRRLLDGRADRPARSGTATARWSAAWCCARRPQLPRQPREIGLWSLQPFITAGMRAPLATRRAAMTRMTARRMPQFPARVGARRTEPQRSRSDD